MNYFAVLFERIFHVFDMSSYALCVRVRVGRLTFDSREASSLLEADIGVAVHEIMGIMNRVKHRPRGQYFSQRAGEKKKKTLSVASSSTSLCFLQTEEKCQPKNIGRLDRMFISLTTSNACLQARQQGHHQSVGVLAKHAQIGPSLMRDVGRSGREAVG